MSMPQQPLLSARKVNLLAAACGLLIANLYVVQPIADIVAIAKANNALVHTDAVQAAGKI